MSKESKRKLLHYRRAEFLKPVGTTLQMLLEEALHKCTPVTDRFEKIGEGDETDAWHRFINTHRSALGMEFGNLVLYAPDQNRHIIAIDENADELDIEQIAPPTIADGKKRQFLESLLYYGIKDNHIILLQSISLKARDLELYLNWLLRRAGVIDNENAVYLNNTVPPLSQERMEAAEIKSVRVGTPLIDASASSQIPVSVNEDNSLRSRLFGEGLDILKAIMPERLKGLSWTEFGAGSDLEVFVEITYKRQANEDSRRLLNKITTAMRHIGDDDMRIELKNGGVMVGTDLQVKAFKQIETYNGLVDPEDVFRTMQHWLLEILSQRLVDAE